MCYLPVPLIDSKHWEKSMPQTMHFHVPSAYNIILSWEHLLMKFWIHSFIYEFNSSRNAYLLQNTSSDPFYRMNFTDLSVVQRGKNLQFWWIPSYILKLIYFYLKIIISYSTDFVLSVIPKNSLFKSWRLKTVFYASF